MSEEIKEILDCITDLQQENERLKDYKDLYKDLLNQSEDNIKQLIKILHKYKSRCEKAIEYINNNYDEEPHELNGLVCGDELLNILNGSDENE